MPLAPADVAEADGSESALPTRTSVSGASFAFAFANPGGSQPAHGFVEAPLTPMLMRLPFMPPPPVPDQGWDAPPAADPDPILSLRNSASSTPEPPEPPAPSVDAPASVSTTGITPPQSPPQPPRSLISKIAGEKSHSFGKHAAGGGSLGPSPPASGSSTPTAATRAAAAKARDSGSASGGHAPLRHSDSLTGSQQAKPETPSPGGSEPPSRSRTAEGDRRPVKAPSPRFLNLEGSGESDSVASVGPNTRDNSLLDVGVHAGAAVKQPSRLRMRLAIGTPAEDDEGDKNEASGKVEGGKGKLAAVDGPAANRVGSVAAFPGRVHVAGGHGGGSRLSTPGGGGGGALGGGGMQPLANALSAQMKFHRQRVAAVFSSPVLFGEEALQEDADARWGC